MVDVIRQSCNIIIIPKPHPSSSITVFLQSHHTSLPSSQPFCNHIKATSLLSFIPSKHSFKFNGPDFNFPELTPTFSSGRLCINIDIRLISINWISLQYPGSSLQTSKLEIIYNLSRQYFIGCFDTNFQLVTSQLLIFQPPLPV